MNQGGEQRGHWNIDESEDEPGDETICDGASRTISYSPAASCRPGPVGEDLTGFFSSFLLKMHEKRGNFCISY